MNSESLARDQLRGPELDYAFLAEYARSEGESLTAVGASFTRVVIPSFPAEFTLYVAGRFRAPEKSQPFDVDLVIRQVTEPGEEIKLSAVFDPSVAENPYRGRVGLTFAVGIPVTLHRPGLHEVKISYANGETRALYFEANVVDQQV